MKNLKIKVLVVFANPHHTDTLRLGAEDRAIHESIRLSRYRENIELTIRHATTINDLRRSLLDEKFQIMHISGHGTERGLILENESGGIFVVSQLALANLFRQFRSSLKCVILNACYSISQGQLISLGIPYTIAMEGPINDRAAIEFSRGFYDAIGAGKRIPFAYQHGCNAANLSIPNAQFEPVLLRIGETHDSDKSHGNNIEVTRNSEIHFRDVKALVGLAIDLSGSMSQNIQNNSGRHINRLESLRQSIHKLARDAQQSIRENKSQSIQTSIDIFVYGFGLRTKVADVCDLLSLINIGQQVIKKDEIEELKRQFSQDMQNRYQGYEGTEDFLRQRGLGNLVDVFKNTVIKPTAETKIRERIMLEVKARLEKHLQMASDLTMPIEEVVHLWENSGDVLSSAEQLIFGNTPMKKALMKVADRFKKELSIRDKDTVSTLFILSDGLPHDGDPLPIVQKLKSSGITVISCFITDQDIANPRVLYNRPELHWDDGAKLMFEMASTMEDDSEIVKFLLDKGWTIYPHSKLFVQLNHSIILEEFIQITLSPLESPSAIYSLPRGM
jgi:hypothetical protein